MIALHFDGMDSLYFFVQVHACIGGCEDQSNIFSTLFVRDGLSFFMNFKFGRGIRDEQCGHGLVQIVSLCSRHGRNGGSWH